MGEYALMATLNLNSAFDVVNEELLNKRLRILGLPSDMMSLISEWLKTRYFYVGLYIENSYIHCTRVGTAQGSILGPILYALFMSPIFDHIVHKSKQISDLLNEMQRSIGTIVKWLSGSGLKVNGEKTEICLFYRKDYPPVKLMVNGIEITSKTTFRVFGVNFDSKLNWHFHI